MINRRLPRIPSVSYEENYSRSGSPAQLGDFEEELTRNGRLMDTPMVMALAMEQKHGQSRVGVALLNPSTHKISVHTFTDNDGFRNVEYLFVQLGIKECLIPKVSNSTLSPLRKESLWHLKDEVSVDVQRLKSLARMCQVMIIERPKPSFGNKTVLEDLSKRSYVSH